MRFLITFLLVFYCFSAFSQVLTKEDSLTAGLIRSNNTTVISGYGQLKSQYDFRLKTANTELTRNVLFVGHRFKNNIYFFSEMELENAKVVGGKASGEISMEQLFLKFNINRSTYLQAGLFIPRIGIINENHLPTTYNGNDRPFVETFVIPATWREIGVGLYGSINTVPGLNYSVAVLTGLNSANFTNDTGIVNGRMEGASSASSGIALTNAWLLYVGDWRIQASWYYGGSAGPKRQADSLHLQSGPFGIPVALAEANAQYHGRNGFSLRALVTGVSIQEAGKINFAYGKNTPQNMYGAYIELGYNFYKLINPTSTKNLTLFYRQEAMDLGLTRAENYGEDNDVNRRFYSIAGITFQPTGGVIVKVDYVMRNTGDRNPALLATQFPRALPYYSSNGFFNVGIGYSF